MSQLELLQRINEPSAFPIWQAFALHLLSFEVELKEFYPEIPLTASPRLLLPIVELHLFPCKREIPTSVFAFLTNRRLVYLNMRPSP